MLNQDRYKNATRRHIYISKAEPALEQGLTEAPQLPQTETEERLEGLKAATTLRAIIRPPTITKKISQIKTARNGDDSLWKVN